jgi:hypothetical protein
LVESKQLIACAIVRGSPNLLAAKFGTDAISRSLGQPVLRVCACVTIYYTPAGSSSEQWAHVCVTTRGRK